MGSSLIYRHARPAGLWCEIVLPSSLDKIADEYKMDALAIHCWTEMRTQLGISPCVVMGALNDIGLATSCEADNGHRHHVSLALGWVQAPLHEALGHYLGFQVKLPQGV